MDELRSVWLVWLWPTCSIQSSVPWYRAAPLWFIMRVRTTSTGLEAKAPARPHAKLDLGDTTEAQVVIFNFCICVWAKSLVRNSCCDVFAVKISSLIPPSDGEREPFSPSNNIKWETRGRSCDSANSQEVCVHGVPHVAWQDQMLLGDVIDWKLNTNHDGSSLSR